MNEQLKVVENKRYPEIDTENYVIQQEYIRESYYVAVFYTSKQSGQERYINAALTNLDTDERTYLEPIRMIESYEIEQDQDEKNYVTDVDVEDLNSINCAINDFLERQRLEPIRRQSLARYVLALEIENFERESVTVRS